MDMYFEYSDSFSLEGDFNEMKRALGELFQRYDFAVFSILEGFLARSSINMLLDLDFSKQDVHNYFIYPKDPHVDWDRAAVKGKSVRELLFQDIRGKLSEKERLEFMRFLLARKGVRTAVKAGKFGREVTAEDFLRGCKGFY